MSNCGSCTACCFTMRVDMTDIGEGIKDWRTPCKFACQGQGCTIYSDRPDLCRGFECIWLTSQRWPALTWPSALRPDRTGVVVEMNTHGNVIAHAKSKGAWRSHPKLEAELLRFTKTTNVMIVTKEAGDEHCYWLRGRDGELIEMEFVGVDAASNERKYKLEGQHR